MDEFKKSPITVSDRNDEASSNTTGSNNSTIKLPGIKSRKAKAIVALLGGKYLSHPDFIASHDGWRLSAAIYGLRMDGWEIDDVWHETKTSRFKKYFIIDKDINLYHSQIGERLSIFIKAVKKVKR